MDRWSGKVAVVTGASAGIGLDIAKALVRRGMIVAGLARRKAKMEEAMKDASGPGKFYAVECDVTKEEQVRDAFDFVGKNLGCVRVLINNAGELNKGEMTTMDSNQLANVVNLNIMGQLHCTRQAVKMMRENEHPDGHIINMGSQVGHKVPYVEDFSLNIYPATKFALRALSETLQNELRGTQIRVTHVSPGVVRSDFFETAGADPSFLQMVAALEPEDVADAVVFVLGTKPHVQIAELTIRHLNDYFR
ncbi:farnesol dehydrogenase-like [Phymastichus coffea]|uniref:farnesol dehydrogenase-like n=1 Tax=Phymastichus coffea TaxID=108790 RepID=UPI00273BFF80|nr:farnesol dehydrogenase-like [Phymastichus coffea]